METLLITGSEGLCGKNLVNFFLSKKYSVCGIDKKKSKKHNFLHHNLKKTIPFKKLPEKIDCIIHLAAKIDQKDLHPISTMINNILSTYNILEFARLKKIKKIIYTSSSTVYLNPITTYGLSKSICEDLVNLYSKQFSVNSTIFRLGYVLGKPLPKRYFIHKLIDEIKKDKPITIFNKDNTFSFIDVEDIARFCEKAIIDNITGTYNLTGAPISVKSIVEILLKNHKQYTKKPSYIEKEGSLSFKYPNKNTFVKFGLKYKISFEESMERILNNNKLPRKKFARYPPPAPIQSGPAIANPKQTGLDFSHFQR